jgi:H+-transporting ATPase
MFLPNGGIIENFGSIQGILFLEVSLTENWLIFVTRGGNTWPSWQLVGAILGVDVISTLFCVFGWLTQGLGVPSDPSTHNVNLSRDGHTSIVTVLIVWGYSIGVTIVIAIVYYLLSSMEWLDNLGRAKRSHADTQMENILMHLSKVAVAHERDEHGADRWHLTPKATEAEEDD